MRGKYQDAIHTFIATTIAKANHKQTYKTGRLIITETTWHSIRGITVGIVSSILKTYPAVTLLRGIFIIEPANVVQFSEIAKGKENFL